MDMVGKPEGSLSLRRTRRRWNINRIEDYIPDSDGSDRHDMRTFVNKIMDVHQPRTC
jgi:hypothetical protein